MEAGKLYHIYNRGNNREDLFKEKKNYYFFLQRFNKHLGHLVDVHAFCLMPNHFHILLRIKEPEIMDEHFAVVLTNAFRNFFISYAKAINKSYGRVGSLFQYKFKRKEIESDIQYKINVAYIHFNPVKARLARKYTDWPFSSYNTLLSTLPTSLARQELFDAFGGKAAFLEFHEAYAGGGGDF